MRTVTPQRALHVIRHHAAVPDVEQPGELELAVAEGAPEVPCPAGIWIGENALVRIGDRKACRIDIHRAARSPGAGRADRAAEKGGVGYATVDVALRTHHAELLTDLRDSRPEEDVLRAVQREHDAAVAGPLQAHLPTVVRFLDWPHVEGRLKPAVPELGSIGVLLREPRRRSKGRRQNHIDGLGVVVGK